MKETFPTDSLAKLIRVAIKDARSLDRDMFHPNYAEWLTKPQAYRQADMLDYALPAKKCLVCLAGAAIAGQFDYDLLPKETEPTDELFTVEEERALKALDHVRIGRYEDAYYRLGLHGMALVAGEALSLGELPPPNNSQFKGWGAFDSHLQSLEGIADKLEILEGRNPV